MHVKHLIFSFEIYWLQLQTQISFIMWFCLKGNFLIIIRCFCVLFLRKAQKSGALSDALTNIYSIFQNKPSWLSYWSSNAGMGCCGIYKWPYHSMCSRPTSLNWQSSRVQIQPHWQCIINGTKKPIKTDKTEFKPNDFCYHFFLGFGYSPANLI